MKLKLLDSELPIPKKPWSGMGKRIERRIRKALYEFDLIGEDQCIGLALSGGKDSLTLLHMLSEISGRGFPPFRIVALHVSGAFSCGAGLERDYLERLCAKMGVELHVAEAIQSLDKLECYSCARERRKAIFSMAKQAGCTRIAFGHHREDNVETVLMNLLHKGVFDGIAPKIDMVRYGVTLVRPLYFVPEEDIVHFAKSSGFARIVCQCPVGQRSRRKRTRSLIETLEAEYPYARVNLARAILKNNDLVY